MADNGTRTDLFSPITMGALELNNRIAMAPLTRSRYGEDVFPVPCTPLTTPNAPVPV